MIQDRTIGTIEHQYELLSIYQVLLFIITSNENSNTNRNSAGIVSKRLNNSSNFFSSSGPHTILVFHTKRYGNIPTGTLKEATNCREYEIFAIFDQYLALSQK